jgi:hypothetical protein
MQLLKWLLVEMHATSTDGARPQTLHMLQMHSVIRLGNLGSLEGRCDHMRWPLWRLGVLHSRTPVTTKSSQSFLQSLCYPYRASLATFCKHNHNHKYVSQRRWIQTSHVACLPTQANHGEDAWPSSAAFDLIADALSSDAERKDAIKKGGAIFAFTLKNEQGEQQDWHIDLKETGTVGKGLAPEGKKPGGQLPALSRRSHT